MNCKTLLLACSVAVPEFPLFTPSHTYAHSRSHTGTHTRPHQPHSFSPALPPPPARLIPIRSHPSTPSPVPTPVPGQTRRCGSGATSCSGVPSWAAACACSRVWAWRAAASSAPEPPPSKPGVTLPRGEKTLPCPSCGLRASTRTCRCWSAPPTPASPTPGSG